MAYSMMVLNSCLSQIRVEVGAGLKNMHESQISTEVGGYYCILHNLRKTLCLIYVYLFTPSYEILVMFCQNQFLQKVNYPMTYCLSAVGILLIPV